jgi:N-acetylneuraminic acid mutarotase
MRLIERLFVASIAIALTTMSAVAGEWREGAPSATGRAFAASAVLGDEIYIAGGAGISTPQSSFEAYDMIGDIWRSLPALPMGVQQAAMATVNGRLYLSGGYLPGSRGPDNAEFWVFDPAVGFWVQGPEMPGARAWHQMIGVNGRLFVVGGVGSRAERVFVFDPSTEKWDTLSAPLPVQRAALSLLVHEGEIWAIGGRATNGAPSARVDILNPDTDRWRSGPKLPEPRASAGASVVSGRVHVVGGEQVSPPRTFDTHFVLNGEGDGWDLDTPLNTPRHGVAVAASDGRMYVVGGATGPGVFTVFTISDLVSIYLP